MKAKPFKITIDENNVDSIVEIIKAIVSQYYDVPIPLMFSKTRKWEILHARHSVVYFVLKLIPSYFPLQVKSKWVGYGKDHSILIHIGKKFEDMLTYDKQLRKELNDMEGLIESVLLDKQEPLLEKVGYMNFNNFVAFRKKSNEVVCMVGIDSDKMQKIKQILGDDFQEIEMSNTGIFIHNKKD